MSLVSVLSGRFRRLVAASELYVKAQSSPSHKPPPQDIGDTISLEGIPESPFEPAKDQLQMVNRNLASFVYIVVSGVYACRRGMSTGLLITQHECGLHHCKLVMTQSRFLAFIFMVNGDLSVTETFIFVLLLERV